MSLSKLLFRIPKFILAGRNDQDPDEGASLCGDAMKALKRRLSKDALADLEAALTSQGLPCSKCVTLARSVDGRIQLRNRKEFPHVIYCRLWRWPDLASYHELKSATHCKYPFTAKQANVCLNPFHYERIQGKGVPVVVVPELDATEPAAILTSSHSPLTSPFFAPSRHEPLMNIPGAWSQLSQANDAQLIESATLKFAHLASLQAEPSNEQGNETASSLQVMLASNGRSPGPFPAGRPPVWEYPEMISFPPSHDSRSHTPTGGNCNSLVKLSSVAFLETARLSPAITVDGRPACGSAKEDAWCTVAYFEHNSRVGNLFYCVQPSVHIDGFSNGTSENRFCLGSLSNNARTESSLRVRRNLGAGVHLYFLGGDIYLDNLLEHCIFVQSRTLNRARGLHPLAIVKLRAGLTMRLFSSSAFAALLQATVPAGFAATMGLVDYATIRLSFIKGWGGEYGRADITATPAWLEIHLNYAHIWLDPIVRRLAPPTERTSSTS